MPFERGGRKPEALNIFCNGKCELIANFSATWPLREGRDGKCEGRNEKCEFLARESVSWLCEFLARESVNSSPILARQWWRHFRLSLSLSLSVCISLSLSLSPKVPHAQYRKRFRASYNTSLPARRCPGISAPRWTSRLWQAPLSFLASRSLKPEMNSRKDCSSIALAALPGHSRFARLVRVCDVVLPWPKKRTILEIRGEKNAVPRVISCSIRRDQRRAKVADSRGSDLPCADRAWSSMISHVEQRSSRRESRWWFFFLARVVLCSSLHLC